MTRLLAMSGTPRYRWGALCLLVLGCLATFASPAIAQKELSGKKNDITRMLREGTIDDADLFNAYFTKFLFPQFAIGKGANSETYGRLRKELKIFSNTGKGEALATYNKLVLAGMTNIVTKSKDSAARVNALLVIGELNELVDNKPRPLGDALRVLAGVVLSPKFSDELKIAAMIGLDRYAAAGAIPPGKKSEEISQALLKLLKQAEPPANRTADGHNWMRRSAAQILAKMGNPGADNSVLLAMAEIAADPNARPTLRCEMAHCIGQLKFPQGTKVDFQALANMLGHQAVEICDEEIDRAAEEKRAPSRGLLMYAVYCAKEGIERLQSAAAGTPNVKFISDLSGKFKALYLELDDLDLSDDDVAGVVAEKIAELQTTLGPKAQLAKQKDVVAAADSKDKTAEPAKQ